VTKLILGFSELRYPKITSSLLCPRSTPGVIFQTPKFFSVYSFFNRFATHLTARSGSLERLEPQMQGT